MGTVDRQFVDVLLSTLHNDDGSKAFVYTGGCWLYGETGDTIATESSPPDPLAGFAWAVPTAQAVVSASWIRGMVIHPAMVYDRDGGVLEHIFDDARRLGHARVIGSESVRWPLVHRADLAELYALILERGQQGDVYNAAAIEGMPIGLVTRALGEAPGHP